MSAFSQKLLAKQVTLVAETISKAVSMDIILQVIVLQIVFSSSSIKSSGDWMNSRTQIKFDVLFSVKVKLTEWSSLIHKIINILSWYAFIVKIKKILQPDHLPCFHGTLLLNI